MMNIFLVNYHESYLLLYLQHQKNSCSSGISSCFNSYIFSSFSSNCLSSVFSSFSFSLCLYLSKLFKNHPLVHNHHLEFLLVFSAVNSLNNCSTSSPKCLLHQLEFLIQEHLFVLLFFSGLISFFILLDYFLLTYLHFQLRDLLLL